MRLAEAGRLAVGAEQGAEGADEGIAGEVAGTLLHGERPGLSGGISVSPEHDRL
jgi:hypothetical protein